MHEFVLINVTNVEMFKFMTLSGSHKCLFSLIDYLKSIVSVQKDTKVFLGESIY